MAEKIVIAQLDLDVQSLTSGINESQAVMARLKTELVEIKKTSGETSVQFTKAEAELKKYKAAFDAQTNAANVNINVNQSIISQYQTIANSAGQASAAVQSQTKTFNDYKQQALDAANSINVFNGGFGGLISRAQEAGGAGPLVKSAFMGISDGIGGMTKASLAFVATPMGAVITAISLALKAVIGYFTQTQEGIDKVTAVTRPMQAIFNTIMGVFQKVGKYLVEAFENPQQAIEDLYQFVKQNLINRFTAFGTILEGIINLDFKKVGNGVIQATTGVENMIDKTKEAAKETGKMFAEAAKKGADYDRLQKKLEKGQADYTAKTSQLGIKLAENNRIASNANKPFAEREATAKTALQTARESNKLAQERLSLEIETLEAKMQANGVTLEEKNNLEELVAQRNEAASQAQAQEEGLASTIGNIRDEQAAQAQQARQKSLQDNIAKQKAELDLYVAQNANKAMTMDEELAYAQNIADKKKALAQAEFNASKKTETDKLALKLANTKVENDLAQTQANAAVANAAKELEAFKNANQSKLEDGKFLSDTMYNDEKARLDAIAAAERQYQEQRLTEGVINQETYNAEILRINTENKDAQESLTAEREEAKKSKEAIDLENKRLTDTANMDYDLGFQLAKLDAQKQQEIEAAEASGADVSQIEEKYAKLKTDTEKQVMNNKLDLANSTFGNLSTILGKESKAGKAMAIAQATIDTYKSAVAAYGAMANIPGVGPALGAVAAGAAVASGLANVKKIASTKAPKAEKGALFNIGGRRHSAGGTMFTGADGTRFEAEKGELIGVMNRNAARHFMAFNNAFPAGGGSMAGNYFESGGMVSRDIAPAQINMQELANLTAEAVKGIPAPVVAVEDIVTQGNSYVQVREGANF